MAEGTGGAGYTRAGSVAEAIGAPGEFRAGGTDLQERLRSHAGEPGGRAIVDLRDITGLDGIELAETGARIGALVRIADVGAHPGLQASYRALTLPAQTLATPQIRSMATMGGALCQRTRCAYYRHPDLACPKKGNADSCPSRQGFHELGVCFDFGPCVYPHPSSVACALLTYDAEVEVAGRGRLSIAELYGDGSDPTRDHMLEPGELITRVILPPADADDRVSYVRLSGRRWAEWPLVEVAVRLVMAGDTIRRARVGVGGVANIPFRLTECEGELEGRAVTAELFERAAGRSTERAEPLPQTAYKVHMVEAAVLEALTTAASGSTPASCLGGNRTPK